MKKYLMMALVATLSLGFASCGDDDDPVPAPAPAPLSASAQVLAQLKDNQVSYGDVKQATFQDVDLGVRRAGDGDNGAHYLSLQYKNPNGNSVSVRFDINTPVVGKDIDLTTYGGLIYQDQFNFGFMIHPDEKLLKVDSELWYGEEYSGYYWNKGSHVEYDKSETCFSEGHVKTIHDKDGFRLELHGTMKDGNIVALKVNIPESEIGYW